MLAIEPRGLDRGDEELRAVRVLTGVGHREEADLLVLELEVLVYDRAVSGRFRDKNEQRTSKLLAVDRLAASAVVAGEVATLKHEVGDDTVETRALVAEAVLTSAELAEVASRLGDSVVVELEDDAAGGLVRDGDVKLDTTLVLTL